MEYPWSAADIAICRSGASTVAEQLSFQVPAIFIPFPRATDDHQTANAEVVQALGGAMVLQEHELDCATLLNSIEKILISLPQMKVALGKFPQEKTTDLPSLVYDIIRGNKYE